MDQEKSINKKLCKKKKKRAKETHEMLKLVCGCAVVTMKTVYKWIERFRNACESVEERTDHNVLQHKKPMRMLKE
jgi:truncated hemoglobin YjbI